MISKLSVASLLFCSTMACADSVIFHLRSHHSERNHDEHVTRMNKHGDMESMTRRGMNNNNLGIAYQTDSGYSIGVYHNSLRRTSFYAGKAFMANEYLGVYVGAATGYNWKGSPVMPFVAGLVNIPVTDEFSVLFSIIPKKKFDGYVVINSSLVWKFD